MLHISKKSLSVYRHNHNMKKNLSYTVDLIFNIFSCSHNRESPKMGVGQSKWKTVNFS